MIVHTMQTIYHCIIVIYVQKIILWIDTFIVVVLAGSFFFTTIIVYAVICKAFPPLSFQVFLAASIFFWDLCTGFKCFFPIPMLSQCWSVNYLSVCSTKALHMVVSSLLDCTYLLLSIDLLWDSWAFTFQLLYLSSLLVIYHRFIYLLVLSWPCLVTHCCPRWDGGEKQRAKVKINTV